MRSKGNPPTPGNSGSPSVRSMVLVSTKEDVRVRRSLTLPRLGGCLMQGVDYFPVFWQFNTMPEKSLSELTRDLREIYRRGNDALQRENFDYAIELFTQVLNADPAMHEIRRALRTAQIRKAGTKGGGFF